jgi:hypothetical protein
MRAQLVGHGVDRGGELLAHASAEVTGVADDDQAAGPPGPPCNQIVGRPSGEPTTSQYTA